MSKMTKAPGKDDFGGRMNVVTTLCPMPSTCRQVGECLYLKSACLTSPTAANDVPASPTHGAKSHE